MTGDFWIGFTPGEATTTCCGPQSGSSGPPQRRVLRRPIHKACGVSPQSNRTLTVGAGAGLTARLRILISGLALAEMTQRHFRMLWPLTSHCAAPFNSLFTNPWNVATLAGSQAEEVKCLPRFASNELPALLASNEPHLARRHMSWHEFPAESPLMARCRSLMNELQPLPQIVEKVDRFREAHCRPEMIGVHLRRGDYVALRPDKTHNTDKAIEATDAFLEQHPTAGILLCTDEETTTHSGDGEVRQRFAARYGDRLVQTAPSTYDRSDPAAIESAPGTLPPAVVQPR